MSNPEVERSIEAILMVVDEPVTELTLATVLGVTVGSGSRQPDWFLRWKRFFT